MTQLTTAAMVDGFLGFAVGRTGFWDPRLDMRIRRSRGAALAEIPRRYREYGNIFERARIQAPATVS